MIVGLHNIRMRGYHGIYEHEKINGNDFIINVEVGFESDDQIVDLHQTINYETVLNIVEKHMNIPTLLLENIVQNIEKDLKKSFFEINFYKIRIDKCNPPMGQKIDSSYVCNEWKKK